eukprot:5822040-Pleurochrysis_carterae.AAC.5
MACVYAIITLPTSSCPIRSHNVPFATAHGEGHRRKLGLIENAALRGCFSEVSAADNAAYAVDGLDFSILWVHGKYLVLWRTHKGRWIWTLLSRTAKEECL